jgi:hypothetical protein
MQVWFGSSGSNGQWTTDQAIEKELFIYNLIL